LYDKNDKDFHCTNKPDEIESLLENAPVAIKTNSNDILIGTVTYASHRSKTSLYYGDIVLENEYNNWNKIRVVDVRGVPTKENSHKLKTIIVYVEKVEDE
jgi:hypothetical protein